MQIRLRSLAALAALALAAAAAAIPACAGSSDTQPGMTGGAGGATTTTTASSAGGATTTGTGGATGGGGGTTPMSACKPSSDTTFAVYRLYFGDTDWTDVAGPNAWQTFGLDVDGIASTGTAQGVCLPSNNAMVANVHTDGPNGLDNSFGKNVLPTFLQSIQNLPSQANGALINGDFSILIRLGGLGTGPDQAAIPGRVYSGAFLPDVPLFDGTDCWPVTTESLTDPTSIDAAKLSYPASTLASNHWDSVSTGDLVLTLEIFGFQGQATIHHARVVMDIDPDHQGVQQGIISGVLDTEEFVAAIDKLMTTFDPTQCGGGTLIDGINLAIRRASDIMKDGTQNPAATCDGITIGLGFKAGTTKIGPIAPPLDPPADPCP